MLSQDFARQIGRTFTTITLPQLYSSGYDAQERRKIIGNTAKVMEVGTDIKIAEVFPYTPAGKQQALEAVESLALDLAKSGFNGTSRTFSRPIFFEFKNAAYLVYAHYILMLKGKSISNDDQEPKTALGATEIVEPVGGIDLTADKTRLEIRGNGNSVRFNLDAESLKNIKLDGLEPVIVNVAPVKDIPLAPNVNSSTRP